MIIDIYDINNNFEILPSHLNCHNGIIDLKTGKLLNYKPEDLIIQCIPSNYNPSAQAPKFKEFLNQIFDNDKNLIEYVKCILGYTITGETKEQCTFIACGQDSKSKVAFFEIFSCILGIYYKFIPFGVLITCQKRVNKRDIILTSSQNVRFVKSYPPATLNDNKIKSLVASNPITAAKPYGKEITYIPHYKVWLEVGCKPKIKSQDKSILKHIRIIPFSTNQNQYAPQLEELQDEFDGILTWLVEGAVSYYKNGLPEDIV